MKKIGFIGAGKVGFSLGKYISEKAGDAYEVYGYFSRDPASARAAAAFAGGQAFGAAEELAAGCDLLLLTVPDDQIESTWLRLRNALPPGSLLVGHCSGCLDSSIFHSTPEDPASALAFGSIHPIIAIHDRETAYQKLPSAYFTIEGDDAFIEFSKSLLTSLGNPFSTIQAENKIRYHAASVMVSNLVNALTAEGMNTFKECGLDEEFAEKAWRALFLENAQNIVSIGPVLALTGPVERADAATVEKHLNALTGETKEIYRLLSLKLTETAQLKNPNRDYTELRKILCLE